MGNWLLTLQIKSCEDPLFISLCLVILIRVSVSFLTQVTEHQQLIISSAQWNCIVHRLVVKNALSFAFFELECEPVLVLKQNCKTLLLVVQISGHRSLILYFQEML